MSAQTYELLTSIASIDESAQYVLGIEGTGFHYTGTSSWGKCALPSAQSPIYYTLKKADDGSSFTAKATISGNTYYLQIPTSSNNFSMATSAGTNTDIIIGTTQVSGTNYAVANKNTTARHLRLNGTSGLRSYATTTTGSMAFFYKVVSGSTPTLEESNFALTGAPITLSFDLYNNASAQVIHYTTSSTGEVSVESSDYATFVVDQTAKTITVTPTTLTPSTQTITVNQEADNSYKSGNASFTLTITDSTPYEGGDVTFDASVDRGTSPLEKNEVTFTCTNGKLDNGSEYRLYSSSTTTFTLSQSVINAGYFIKRIHFTEDSENPVSNFTRPSVGQWDKDNGIWVGEETSVAFRAGSQVRATKIVVTVGPADPKILSSITLSGSYPTVFKAGETFSHAGLVVTAVYESGATEDVTDGVVVSTPDLSTNGNKTVTVTYTSNGVTKEASYTVNVVDYLSSTWNLATESYASETPDQVRWTSNCATMVVNKASASTNANNYLPPSNTSSRFYKNSTLTITPAQGLKILSIVFTATTDGYANALVNSSWPNASVAAAGTTVTVTPDDGMQATTATIGGTCGFTSVTVNYIPVVTVTSAGWATFAPARNVSFDAAVMSAYVVTDATTTSATLQEVTSVPANTPVLVCAAPKTYALTVVDAATAPTTNLLKVSDGNVAGDGSTIYSLAQIDGKVGFYRVDASVTIPAGKCYLNIQGTPNARAFLTLGGNTETGITTVAADAADGNIYDLTGRRVSGVARGLYIVNGKKVVLK